MRSQLATTITFYTQPSNFDSTTKLPCGQRVTLVNAFRLASKPCHENCLSFDWRWALPWSGHSPLIIGRSILYFNVPCWHSPLPSINDFFSVLPNRLDFAWHSVHKYMSNIYFSVICTLLTLHTERWSSRSVMLLRALPAHGITSASWCF